MCPTIKDLVGCCLSAPTYQRVLPLLQANSDIETVNALWKGLGYYSRAARLLSGAQKIVNEYGGLFPENAKDMMANVPGIGRYSAGAISSIAYNHCEPVVCNPVTVLRLAKPYHSLCFKA